MMEKHAVDLSECLVKMTHWGFTRVHNVCSSTVVDVPWGIGDWLMMFLTFAFMLGAGMGLGAVGYMMFVMVWHDR